jgi:ubiquinol oxidase
MQRLTAKELRLEQQRTLASARLLPRLLAPYVIRPAWSYRLSAHFEDHTEHEYMEFVREHPELERTPFESIVSDDYGRFDSLADVFRTIGYDERVHKLESLGRMETARFQ